MKLSEYIDKRRAHYETVGELTHIKFAVDGRIDGDIRAAEAAGVVWDPEKEEEPLPERLELCGKHLRAGGVRLSAPYIATARQNYRGDLDSTAAAERILAEVVRRWNAWSELRKIAAILRRNRCGSYAEACNLENLIAILDGKEGE